MSDQSTNSRLPKWLWVGSSEDAAYCTRRILTVVPSLLSSPSLLSVLVRIFLHVCEESFIFLLFLWCFWRFDHHLHRRHLNLHPCRSLKGMKRWQAKCDGIQIIICNPLDLHFHLSHGSRMLLLCVHCAFLPSLLLVILLKVKHHPFLHLFLVRKRHGDKKRFCLDVMRLKSFFPITSIPKRHSPEITMNLTSEPIPSPFLKFDFKRGGKNSWAQKRMMTVSILKLEKEK